jgi:hypothetical protein
MEAKGGAVLRRLLNSTIAACLLFALAAEAIAQDALPQSNVPSASATGPDVTSPTPATHTIAAGTRIDLMTLDSVSSESAKVGDKVHFVVANPVVTYGFELIPAGMPLLGTVTGVTRARLHHRDGKIDIHVDDLRIGKALKLRLTDRVPVVRLQLEPSIHSSNQHSWARRGTIARKVIQGFFIALVAVAFSPILVPYFALLLIFWDDAGPPSGADTFLPACAQRAIYVKDPVLVDMSSLIDAQKKAAVPAQSSCAAPGVPQDSMSSLIGVPDVRIR